MDNSLIQDSGLSDVGSEMQQASQDGLICHSPVNAQLSQSPQMIQFSNMSSPPNANVMQFGTSNAQPVVGPMNTLNLSTASHVLGAQAPQMLLNQTGSAVGNFLAQNTNAQAQSVQSVSPSNAELMGSLGGSKKRMLKGMRSYHRVNYDKTTPTQHQTNLYNQILQQQGRLQMQQQASQQQQQQMAAANANFSNTNTYSSSQMLQPQQPTQQVHSSPIQTTTNNYMNALNLSSSGSNFLVQGNQMPSNLLSLLTSNPGQTTAVVMQQQQALGQPMLKQSSSLLSLLAMKNEDTSSTATTADAYKATAATHQTGYKPYPTQQALKNTNYGQLSPRSFRFSSSPPSHQMNVLTDRQQQQLALANEKEMYRSKSLPLNSTLQIPLVKEETFAMPKYQASKSVSLRNRVRSNSMVSKHHGQSSPSLQNAASEPMLKSLAQLLTSSSGSGAAQSSTGQQMCLSNNYSSQANATQQSQRSFMLQQNSGSSPSAMSPTSMLQQMSSSNPNSPLSSFGQSSSASLGNRTSTPSLSPDSMPDQDSPKFSRPGTSSNSISTPTDSLQRRVGHIHAEQKRRYNIKNGFDMLHSLIPQLQQNPNAKLSKAAMLQKGAEYIRQLRTDRDSIKHKMDALQKERDTLNNSLKCVAQRQRLNTFLIDFLFSCSHLQSVLPANGAPVARQRTSRLKELYNDYVTERTLRNWKFWIVS